VFGVLSGCSEKSEQTKASHESVSEKRVIAELPKIGEIVTTETLSDGEEKRSDIRLKQVGSSIQEGIAFPNIIDMNNKAYAKHTKGIQTFTHMKHAKEYAEKHPELYKNGCGSCHHDKNNKPLRNLKEGDDVQNCIECHKKAGYIKGKEAKGLSKIAGRPSNYKFLIAAEDSWRCIFGQLADLSPNNFDLGHIFSFDGTSIYIQKISREQKAPIAIYR